MCKIKIFGLGGLDEDGKNCYVVEVDDSIFIFDCGLKYATGNLLGIDYIMPDFSYLIANKKKIQGVFLTHGHEENIGSVKDLIEAIPDIKIYATKFTSFILKDKGINEKNIIEIKAHKKLTFKENSIFPISVAHNIPDSVMYVLNTKDGSIVYTGDFVIDPMMNGGYDMDLGKIAYIGKQNVLCLLSESIYSEKKGFTSPKHHLYRFFKDTIKHNEKRILFSVLPDNLFTISEIFEASENSHRKIIVMGKRLQNIVNFAKKEGYLSFNDDLLGDLSNVNDDNAMLLISDDLANPYANLNKILHNYDKYVTLKNDDSIVIAEPKHDSTEKLLVNLENDFAMAGCNIFEPPDDKLIMHHASREDLMLMLKLINPTYYMPVRGEYRYMVGNADLATKLDFKPENIFLKQNGDVVTIENKKVIDNFEHIKVSDVLIDGNTNDDIGELVIKDREMLSENGIVLVSTTISKKDKVILVGPEITTRGFIYVKDSYDLIEDIKKISTEVIEKNINPNYVDYNQIKYDIREKLSDFLYEQTECKPMIIAVVQEV
jgi:ribonuclease J